LSRFEKFIQATAYGTLLGFYFVLSLCDWKKFTFWSGSRWVLAAHALEETGHKAFCLRRCWRQCPGFMSDAETQSLVKSYSALLQIQWHAMGS